VNFSVKIRGNFSPTFSSTERERSRSACKSSASPPPAVQYNTALSRDPFSPILAANTCRRPRNGSPKVRVGLAPSASGRVGRHSREADSFAATLTDPGQPMPKSRGRKPKKNRAPVTAAPKRQLDTAQQPPPLSTQPPQRQISVLPQAQRSRWLRLTLRALIIVGVIAVLYALFELGRWGALRWSLL
jgi:hypothetical protein